MWRTAAPVARSTQPSSGTISGTITATGANEKTIRVYCGSASTTVTFSGDTVDYTLNVPYGDHAVTASLVGYKTTTQLATVTSGTPVDLDFTLSTIQKRMDVVASAWRIPPDGESEVTVTAIVRDEEGRRLENETVTWTVNPAYVVSQDTTTDLVGEAHLVIHAPTTPGTEVVSVTNAGLMSRCFIEFAETDAPSIWITSPNHGDMVSGDVEITMYLRDPTGEHPGVSTVSILIDGVEYTTRPATTPNASWASVKAPNGSHEIKAAAVDYDGNTSYSNVVTVVSKNAISEFSVAPEEVTANQPAHISAKLAESANWRVSVKDVYDNEVWAYTGSGTTISVDWPGTSTPDYYTASVSVLSDGTTVKWPVILNPPGVPNVLLVAEEYEMVMWHRTQKELAKIVKSKGLSCVALTPMTATWDRIKPILASPACRYFFIDCHGQWYLPPEPITHLWINSSKHILYAHRWDNSPAPGESDPYHPGYKVAYAKEELGRGDNYMKLAWLGACFGGRIGSYRSQNEIDYYNGKYGIYNCYQTDPNSWNDMADALGITPWAASESPCAYVGWYSFGLSGDSRYDGFGTYPGRRGIIVDSWGTLANGFSFEFTRDWIQNTFPSYFYPKVDQYDWYNNEYKVTPFFNWRFWGKGNVSLF